MYAWSLIWSLIKIRSLLDFYDTINARFIYILVFEPFENAHIHREKLVNRGLLKTDYVPANSIWIFRKNLLVRRVNSFAKRICFLRFENTYLLLFTYSLIQKNGYTFATVFSNKCVTVFLNQTLHIFLITNVWIYKSSYR